MASPVQETKAIQPPRDAADPIEAIVTQEKENALEDNVGYESSHSDDVEGCPVALSQTTSIIPPPVTVPRSKRRGLFGSLTILAEVEVPKHYPRNTKWFITFVIAVAAAAAPLGSAIFFRRSFLLLSACIHANFNVAALGQVSKDLNTTNTVTNLSVALYMLSMSIFPLWWSSFSERLGRRTIYLTSFVLFTVFAILSAVSTSIGMLIVMRILSGGAAASVQAVGAGTIADIWEVKERGRAMGMFYLGPLCGPLFAPIIGGALSQKWDWRSTQWFLAIYGGVMLVFLLLGLPETLERPTPLHLEPVNSQNRMERTLSRVSSRQVAEKTGKWLRILKIVLLDPLKIILYLRYPAVFFTVIYASIAFGSLYILNVSLQDAFGREPYGFSMLVVGLLYIPNSLGYMLASILGGRWMDTVMHREARKAGRFDERGRLVFIPEDRMKENAWFGAFMYPAALIWYGWTVEHGVHWIVPVCLCAPLHCQ